MTQAKRTFTCLNCGTKREKDFPIDEQNDRYCPDCNYTMEEPGMVNEAKHTPTPWKVIPLEKTTDNLDKPTGIAIASYNNEIIANNEPYYPEAITKANAVFIVCAVNSHDSLLAENRRLKVSREALLTVTSAITKLLRSSNNVVEKELLRQATEALKQAGFTS